MRSRVVSFRVTDDLYEEFDRKCQSEGISQTVNIRELVDGACLEKVEKPDTDGRPHVNVIHIEDGKVEKVINADSKKNSWFPLDFSPLFGKGR